MTHIPFLRPNLVRKEAYGDYLTQIDESRIYSNFGPLNSLFEERLLKELFADQGALTTVANATLGLMLAFAHFKRAGGRYAVMPSFTFAATAQAALWCGLTPYFVDIHPDTWCADLASIHAAVHKLGSEIAIVVPYATFGTATDLSFYAELHDGGIPVVVDAAASLGTTTGSHHFGVGFPGAIVFSLHATKAFPVGEGGIIYSRDADTIAQLRRAENFGFSEARESIQPGINAKLSEFHAAIGLATLDAFADKKARRQQVYRWYQELFAQHGLVEQGWVFQRTNGSVPYQFVAALCPPTIRNHAIVSDLKRSAIEARMYFCPACHRQPLFSEYPKSTMTVTDAVSTRIVSLPLWEEMTHAHVEKVVGALDQAGDWP